MPKVLAVLTTVVLSGSVAIFWPESVPWSGVVIGVVAGAVLLVKGDL